MTDAIPEYSHRFRAVKRYDRPEEYGNRVGLVIRADACLHYLRGNRLPYFSVTGEVAFSGARDCETCGCIHAPILRHWPELAPIVALHLSDSNGVPSHDGGNALYYLAGAIGGLGQRYHIGNSERQHWNPDGTFGGYRLSTPEECLQSFADYVRVPMSEAWEIAETVSRAEQRRATITAREPGENGGVMPPTASTVLASIVDGMRPRWRAEADAARALLESLIAAKASV